MLRDLRMPSNIRTASMNFETENRSRRFERSRGNIQQKIPESSECKKKKKGIIKILEKRDDAGSRIGSFFSLI